MSTLPRYIDHVQVPPIKCQGIKSELLNFISLNIEWDGSGKWVEPFLGSGVVLFNIEPERALVADANQHIIRFYQKIQSKEITGPVVREFLEKHGQNLREQGEDYYYQMRDDFNENQDVLYLLFLNRSCYNGMMRFNKSGGYNVPFCKKPNRFRQAYVTRIVNQVNEISKIIEGKDWEFKAWDWEDTMNHVTGGDFVYLDPPYIGRHTGYIGDWEDDEAELLSQVTQSSPAGFALSMWKENKYRENNHIQECWEDNIIRTYAHFYHVGSTEDLRNEMEEALVIKQGYEADEEVVEEMQTDHVKQKTLDDIVATD